ncbi:Fe-S cluster assembly protein SufD [Tissierella sp. Yu-01]|uniref:Fe-S cluster assembly protein SufD n=1 Tax=Tissierella sp. Yu-01 TaxID=3035694 RepID=UPI00240E5447|nr:Fe-S cluster assembly protein SufD [Tissierella sp. Yu-01]WFA08063.1 Fe-S cluster assembly protein SufD [Tissierella sp. Yu-01]
MITWKRIGLDNLTFPDVPEYSKDFIDGEVNHPKEIKLYKTKEVFNDYEYHGLGKEFIEYINNNYNSGATLILSRGTKINEPIKIEFTMDDDNPSVVDYNIIVAEEGSEATIIFDYKSDHAVSAFHNGLTKVYAKENSIINIIKIQRLNDSSMNFDSNVAYVEGRGKVNWISIELGSSISGANYTTFLNGEASEGNLSTIYLGDGTRRMDLGYTMIHKGPRSISNIDTKGVLMDQARKVFRGNLDFKKGARLSKGSEEEYVILLDPKVKSDSIPGLFCEEDDVMGNHAASAGQIDNNKLFYLMSRGLSERDAKKLIVESSFRPIINNIPSETLRKEINAEVERRFLNA